ncbi:methyltransferase domain-containing protein [bacterium]|nr:methyltransferase domain-containing protein [bacterium]
MNLPCPCCGKNSFETLIDFGQVPVSGLFDKLPNPQPPCAPLALEFCPRCAFARKRKYLGKERDYRKIERGTAGQLPCYADWILQEAKMRCLPDGLVVEIGCNEGTFLREMRKEGFSRLLGVEPSPTLAAGAKATGIKVMADYFGISLAEKILDEHGPAALIVCRHTLEHVPNPLPFLQAAKMLLSKGGSFYLECPDSRTLFGEGRIHEIWDEHENYFFGETLGLLVHSAGFPRWDLSRQTNRDAVNLCAWIGEDVGPALPAIPNPIPLLDLYAEFPVWVDRVKGHVRGEILKDPEVSLVAIGAGHPQINYLIFSGAGPHVSILVCRVVSTEEFFRDSNSRNILPIAFAHPEWMHKLESHLKSRLNRSILPYPSGSPHVNP